MQALNSKVSAAAPVARSEVRGVARSTGCNATRVQPVVMRSAAPAASKLQTSLMARQLSRLSSVVCQASENGVAPVSKTSNPLPIVFVSAEVAPWSKTGGLGDVVGGLPIELVKRGHKVITIAPRYDQYYDGWDTSVVVNVDGESVRFFHTIKKGVHRVFVDHPWFLAKVWGKTGSKLYGAKSGADYLDNHKRFTMFCKAAIEAVRVLPFGTGEDCVFVANDWHSALVPLLIKDHYQPKGQFKKAKVALCIHNIAFQGRMWEESLKDMNLPAASKAKLAFQDGYPKVYNEATPLKEDEKGTYTAQKFNKINWLKAGILAADKVLTVSPNYATEISSGPAGGVELDAYIRQVGGAEGIVNGMDIEEWNPKTDKFLTVPYDHTTVYAGKAAAKEALQAEVGLPVDPSAPLFAFIGRLEEQKGVDILLAALPQIVADGKSQVVILGTGKASFEKQVKAIALTNAKGIVKFSAPLAHLITAGADFMVVPSRFEPCGLIQLHAMHYGTVPVVASTGGLVDTVKEGVTGFHVGALDVDGLNAGDVAALAATTKRAAEVFSTPTFKNMVYNCISQDLSWAKPALKWEGVLEALYTGSTAARAKSDSVPVPVAEPIPGPVPAVSRAPISRPSPDLTFGPAKPSGAPAPSRGAGANGASAPKAPTPAAPPRYTYRTATPKVTSPTTSKPSGSSNGTGAARPVTARPLVSSVNRSS